jgi:hypothetical protein
MGCNFANRRIYPSEQHRQIMKPTDNQVKFTAKIEQHEDMDAGYIKFPYDVMKLYGIKGRVAVKAIFDDQVSYRGSLVKMGTPCHILGITKEIRQKLGKSLGDNIKVIIEQDLEIREVIVPADVQAILDKNPRAKKFYEGLSYTDRKEYIRWIETAKQADTRDRRIGIFLGKLKEKKKFIE